MTGMLDRLLGSQPILEIAMARYEQVVDGIPKNRNGSFDIKVENLGALPSWILYELINLGVVSKVTDDWEYDAEKIRLLNMFREYLEERIKK